MLRSRWMAQNEGMKFPAGLRVPAPVSRLNSRAREEAAARWEAAHYVTALDEPVEYPFEWATYARPHGENTRPAYLLAQLPRVSRIAILPGQTFSLLRVLSQPKPLPLRKRPVDSNAARQANLLATMLYNLALLGGVSVVERHAHAHDFDGPSRLFDPGRDAVVEPGRDLRLRNTTRVPLVFVLGVDDRRLYGELRGQAPLNADIEIVTGPIEPLMERDRVQRDPLMAPHEERVEIQGVPGARVPVRRITRYAGQAPIVEDLGATTYAPIGAVLRRPARPAPPNPTKS